jgi:hypothetical protein
MFRIKDADALGQDKADLLPGRMIKTERMAKAIPLLFTFKTLWKTLVLFG